MKKLKRSRSRAHETPFYSSVEISQVTDEEMLPFYAIYRNMSHGRTLEPYEAMLQRLGTHETAEHNALG